MKILPNLPPNWSRMGFTARAGYLCATLRISYEEACSMLAKRATVRRNKPRAVYTPATRQIRLPYADN